MALSSAELLQLQQSLTQLAKASSNIAQFATQLGNVQSQNASTQQTETKYRRTVIDDYASLSEVLKNQSKDFKNTLKNVQGFTQNLDDANRRHKLASSALDALNASITAAGSATAAQTLRQTLLSRVLANVEAERETERAKIAGQNERVSSAIANIIGESRDALRYKSEYEKDFYGRQLASEVRTALDNIASTTGAKFGKQLLEFADIGKLGKFADMQEQVVKSLLDNNQSVNDLNADMVQQYLKLGKSLGYTSTEFDKLSTQMDGWTTGATISLSADAITSFVDATEDIAKVVNDSNEKISQTIDRDLKSFGGQFKAYQFENRNGFDKLFDELRDIKSRHGSLTTGAGREAAADALHSAVGMLGKEVIPAMSKILKAMGTYYTGEYDALTNFVQTSRLTALQLNMTEDQYRQSRAESKATWNIAAQSGQKQLDEFLTSRRRSLEAVYGSEPMLRDKMGTQFYNMINVLGESNRTVDQTIKDFGALSLTSRMSSVELTDLYLNLVNSNENMQLMNSLDLKGRQARMQELRYVTALTSKLGLAGESATQFAKALAEVPTKTVSTADIVSRLGETQNLFNLMKNAADIMGVQLKITNDEAIEYARLKGIKDAGKSLDEQQMERFAMIGSKIAQDQIALRESEFKIMEEAKRTGGTKGESESMYRINEMMHMIEQFTQSSGASELVDPVKNQALAMQKYNQTQGKLITSTEGLRKAIDLQNAYAKQRADEISIPKAITGVFAEGQRLAQAAQGNLVVQTAEALGTGYIIKTLVTKFLERLAVGAASAPLPPQGKLAVGVLSGLAGVGTAAYEMYKSSGKSTTETPGQTSETEFTKPPLPSSQAPGTEADTSVITDQFTKYFSSVEAQNLLISGFLRTLADNSSGMSKDIKEWRELYEFIHPKVTLEPNPEGTKTGDPSNPPPQGK